MTSIFTVERRRNFPMAFENFLKDLQTVVSTASGTSYKMFDYLERCIRYWPYRQGAIGLDDYLKGIGIDITDPKKDEDLLLTLELLINLLYWAPTQDKNDADNIDFSVSFKKNEVEVEANRLIENAKCILEQCLNMMVRKETDGNFSKYYITKRDVHVDNAVAAVPELADLLLSYFDIRNKNDVELKKTTLTKIYSYMEPRRNEYKSYSCSAVSEEFFGAMNTFGLRHNTKSQIRLSPKKKIQVYDHLFMMAVYVLQTNEVNRFKHDIRELIAEKQTQKSSVHD